MGPPPSWARSPVTAATATASATATATAPLRFTTVRPLQQLAPPARPPGIRGPASTTRRLTNRDPQNSPRDHSNGVWQACFLYQIATGASRCPAGRLGFRPPLPVGRPAAQSAVQRPTGPPPCWSRSPGIHRNGVNARRPVGPGFPRPRPPPSASGCGPRR
jgi:hypothetical protein